MTTTSMTTEEEIEGLGTEADDATVSGYPIDTLLIRNENRTVHNVLRRIAQGSFIMNPDFQRDFIWPVDKQSKLIESVLMRIPLPVFYLGEDDEGHMIVVDGLQRLSTFQRFVNNEFALTLPAQAELDKKLFKDLPPKMQNRIEDCNLILYIIDAKVPDQARLDIFDRVNGGVALTRQQMRNCLYMGPATRFLKDEAESELFKEATGNSIEYRTMRDRELVNRFCAFHLLPLEDYKGNMDVFLAAALKKMNKLPPGDLAKLSTQFHTSLANNIALFARHAFRKHTDGKTTRSVFNAALWDVMTTTLANHSETAVQAHASPLNQAFHDLMADSKFISAITSGPNNQKSVLYRFNATKTAFQEVFNVK